MFIFEFLMPFSYLFYRFLMPNHPGSIDNVIEHLPDSMKLNFKNAVEVFVDKIGKQNWYLGLCLFKAVARRRVRPLSGGQYKL
jgi:hypothetical protein